MRVLSIKNVIIASAIAISPCLHVQADEVTVQDTSGFTRAAANIDEPTSIEFNVAGAVGGAADGIPVTLTNAATGEALSASTVGGTVTFNGVTPGLWTVATTSQSITFTGVSILGAASTGAAGGSLIAIGTGAAVVGGGTAAAIAIADTSDNNDDELSPSS